MTEPRRGLFRSMVDPFGILSPGTVPRPSDVVGTWLDVTEWWVDAVAEGSDLLQRQSQQVLPELLSGLSSVFLTRHVDLTVHGLRIRGVLEALYPRARDLRGVALELSELDVAGLSLERASVVARTVTLDVAEDARLVASDVDLVLRAPMSTVAHWLDRGVEDWGLSAGHDGGLMARHDRRGIVAHGAPVARADRLDFEVQALEWRGRKLAVPRFLRLTRSVDVDLGQGVVLRGTLPRGADVDVHLSLPSVIESLDLRSLRGAIADGGPIQL